jgi:hypothetical protein
MQSNPYAPPLAEVADAAVPLAERPALWNPWAAVLWSILFTPAFGAFLHMKNWQALGQPAKAKEQRTWFYGVIVALFLVMLSAILLPESKLLDLLSRVAGLGMLLAWYYSSAKAQRTLVDSRFGGDYPRKGWLKPILAVVAVFVAFMLMAVLIGVVLGAAGA